MPKLVSGMLEGVARILGRARRAPVIVPIWLAGVGNVDIVEGIPGKASGMDYSAYR